MGKNSKSHKHSHHHPLHSDIIQRLKRAYGHLDKVIDMLEQEEECVKVTQQLHAVSQAISNAKSTLIRQHIESCLISISPNANNAKTKEMKEIAKYL